MAWRGDKKGRRAGQCTGEKGEKKGGRREAGASFRAKRLEMGEINSTGCSAPFCTARRVI